MHELILYALPFCMSTCGYPIFSSCLLLCLRTQAWIRYEPACRGDISGVSFGRVFLIALSKDSARLL